MFLLHKFYSREVADSSNLTSELILEQKFRCNKDQTRTK